MLALIVPFIGGKLGKFIAIGLLVTGLVAAWNFYIHSVKNAGRVEERAAEVAIANKHEKAVMKVSRDVDLEVSREADPAAELRKEWERPDGQ